MILFKRLICWLVGHGEIEIPYPEIKHEMREWYGSGFTFYYGPEMFCRRCGIQVNERRKVQ